jgi:hypothetical protein
MFFVLSYFFFLDDKSDYFYLAELAQYVCIFLGSIVCILYSDDKSESLTTFTFTWLNACVY